MELKREARTNTVQIVDNVLANTERQVSSWEKLECIGGYLLLYKKQLL